MTVARMLVAGGLVVCLTPSMSAQAQVSEETMRSLSTPDKVQSRIGTLEFRDGAPSMETVEKVHDTLDFTRALDAYLNSYGAHRRMRSDKALSVLGQTTIQSSSSLN